MSFTLKQIRYFVAVAEAGQISGAAGMVNISQSALTLAIQDLEATLGANLFTRHSTGLELTPEGRSFLAHANAILDQVSRASQSVKRQSDAVSGKLRVGVTDTLSAYFLMPKLALLRREHPKLDIVLTEASRPSLEDGLLSGTLDVALLLTSNVEASEELESHTFHRSHRRLWTPAGHPLLEREKVSLVDVARYPLVLLRADEAERQARSIWSAHGIEPNVVLETISVEAVRGMVAHGLALTVLSDVVFRSWTVDGLRVMKRDITEPLPTMDVGLVWRRDRQPDTLLQEFSAMFI